MNARLDEQFSKESQVAVAMSIWILGASLFASGIAASYPFEDGAAEAIVVCMVVFAEAACLFNFLRKRTRRNAVTILQITAWAVAFWLRRKGLIGDLSYGVLVGIFVLSVGITVNAAMRGRRR